MGTKDKLRAAALALPQVEERRARGGRATEFVTNAKPFAKVLDGDRDVASFVSADGDWVEVDLDAVADDELERLVVAAWRVRAKKIVQHGYNYRRGFAEVEPLLERLRTLPEMVEKDVANFWLNKRAFLHFHFGETDGVVDVKIGKTWGPPIELGSGRPSPKVIDDVVAEVRRRIDLTVQALSNRS